MFDINAAFDSLPDDLEQARRDFKTKVKELPAFGFARPSKIRQVDIIVRNRAFLQKLMMLYYLEREAVFGGELLEESGKIVSLLIKKQWLPEKALCPDEITYRWAKEPPEIKQRDTGLAERLRRGCDKKIDNNLTYRLLEIESQDIGVELQFTTGDYEEYYETCEALTWELGNVLLSFYEKEKERIRGKKLTGHEILEIVSSDLALRNSIEPFDFLSRCMTAGINTLTIMAFESLQKNFFLMHDRSQSGKPEEEPEGKDEKVEVDEFVAGLAKSFGRMPRKPSEGNKTQEGLAEAIDTWHVVPAGTFQPLTEGDNCRDIELRIERNILREFGEELLNKRKLIEQLGIIHPNRPFEEDCELKHLKKVFSTRATEVRFLGCGIDCVSLKPEFLTLIVTNGDLLLSGIKLRKLRNNWEGKHQFKEFSIESLDKWLKRDDVLPAGAGCIALCLRHHDDVENLIASVIATGSIS